MTRPYVQLLQRTARQPGYRETGVRTNSSSLGVAPHRQAVVGKRSDAGGRCRRTWRPLGRPALAPAVCIQYSNRRRPLSGPVRPPSNTRRSRSAGSCCRACSTASDTVPGAPPAGCRSAPNRRARRWRTGHRRRGGRSAATARTAPRMQRHGTHRRRAVGRGHLRRRAAFAGPMSRRQNSANAPATGVGSEVCTVWDLPRPRGREGAGDPGERSGRVGRRVRAFIAGAGGARLRSGLRGRALVLQQGGDAGG